MWDRFQEFNERAAGWITKNVGTMTCAYLFAIIALVSLPETLHATFSAGVHPLPMVTWVSQNFLQLTLLAVIMAGQELQGRAAETRAVEQYNAIMEMLADIREDHAMARETLKDVQALLLRPE
jgi:hypothetical protein